MGAKSRNKGVALEREVARMIHEHLGIHVRRNLTQYQEKGHGDLVGWPGVLIECKRHSSAIRAQIDAWWLEAVDEAKAMHASPVLIYKLDRQPVRVVVSAHDFIGDSMWHWPIEMEFMAFCEAAREVWL